MKRIVAVLIGFTASTPALAQDLGPVEAQARAIAASHFASTFLLSNETLISERVLQIRMDLVKKSSPVPEIIVWHVRPAISHVPPYTVGWDGDRLLLMGGFPAPELLSTARILRAHAPNMEVEEVIHHLIRLFDPNGGDEVVMPYQGYADSGAAITRIWMRCAPREWLPDRDLRGALGTFHRRTALTRDPNRGDPMWLPVRYTFHFTPHGELLSWAISTGKELNMRLAC